MSLILQHPRSPVQFDPPPSDPRDPRVEDKYARWPTAAEVEAARLETERERAALPFRLPRFDPPTDEQMAVPDATNGLYNLIQQYGAQRVMTWVRNMAAIAGQEVAERPTNRCLADGAMLDINHLCVRCGRDNS